LHLGRYLGETILPHEQFVAHRFREGEIRKPEIEDARNRRVEYNGSPGMKAFARKAQQLLNR